MEASPALTIIKQIFFAFSIAASVIPFVFWVLYLLKLVPQLKSEGQSVRGLFKLLAYDKLSPQSQNLAATFFYLTLAIYIVPCVWVTVKTWGNDYSFLIALFPLFYYFLLAKIFVWQKSDIENKHSKKSEVGPFDNGAT